MWPLQVIMQQILQNLSDMHRTGIVHRDVKPENMILSANGIRMIDLGAAADLRIGINYVPNEYLLDPRYAPPEQYIMSPLTPRHASLPPPAVPSSTTSSTQVPCEAAPPHTLLPQLSPKLFLAPWGSTCLRGRSMLRS